MARYVINFYPVDPTERVDLRDYDRRPLGTFADTIRKAVCELVTRARPWFSMGVVASVQDGVTGHIATAVCDQDGIVSEVQVVDADGVLRQTMVVEMGLSRAE